MANRKYTKKQIRIIRKTQFIGIRLFAGFLAVGSLLGLLFFFRPEVSEKESRELTDFPKFTLSGFLDGSFFSDLSLWYSDTYPMRDFLVAADQKWKKIYGITTSTMMVGGGEQGDEIPAGGDKESEAEVQAAVEEARKKQAAAPPDTKTMEEQIQKDIQQGIYVKDGAAYSVYYYNQVAAEIYTDAMSRAAQALKGDTDVYSILLPNNSGAMLPEDELEKLGGSDQQGAIDYYYSLYDGVKTVPTIETLREHNDEYLYFRTDHHWTSLGAYYVYQNFCKEKGIEPHKLSDFEKVTFSPFLGTFYSSLKNEDMAKNPDSVDAYIPMGTNEMVYWTEDGTEQKWDIITDVSDWSESSGYYCYIGGDKPLAIIENPEIDDGSSCLVLKESYGNCFVPFLVDHYQTVYIMDFRYAQENVLSYVQEHEIQDLIVINNITIIGNEEMAARIDSLLQ